VELTEHDVLVAAEQCAAPFARGTVVGASFTVTYPITARGVRAWMEQAHRTDFDLEWVQTQLDALAERGKLRREEHPITWDGDMGEAVVVLEPRYGLLTVDEIVASSDDE
jgi:hypothetical protein